MMPAGGAAKGRSPPPASPLFFRAGSCLTHVHHYAIWVDDGPRTDEAESGDVHRHTFADGQAEIQRVLDVLRERGAEVEEGVALWRNRVTAPGGGQSRRLCLDDVGLHDCDHRCEATIDPDRLMTPSTGPGPSGDPSPPT